MFGADSAISRVNNLALAGYKTSEQIGFFIINIFKILGTKKTLFHIFILSIFLYISYVSLFLSIYP